MRIFALSDIHIDYDLNAQWIANLSIVEFQDDILILAGDVTDTPRLLEWGLRSLARRFKKVLFVPGNHDLWVIRESRFIDSLQKFDDVCAIAERSGASMQVFCERGVAIIPLVSWYDHSFGEPSAELKSTWMDYQACRWPNNRSVRDIAAYFVARNSKLLAPRDSKVITYSHFLPRIDVMPGFIPNKRKLLYPILGSVLLDVQLRKLNASIHVYGHSHVNRQVSIDGVFYINNAYGYPSESWMSGKSLTCIHEC